MKTALALTCLTAAIFAPSEVRAAAGGIQSCTVSADCTVGEFLFDDSSLPIAGATCTISSKYPNGSSFLSTEPMSGGGSDGWYYQTVNTATTGLYPTTVTCTVSGDSLSIDKSFEVVEAPSTDPNAVASAVWGFSGRTLTSFGTLPAEIWSYSTRTVTTFGTLIADIWSSATRTLTGANLNSGKLATQSDVDSVNSSVGDVNSAVNNVSGKVNNLTSSLNDISTKVDGINDSTETINEIKDLSSQTRLLLEQVVNKPIIENVLEEGPSTDLTEKIKDTRGVASQLYVNSQYLTSQSAVLGADWNSLSGKDLLNRIIEISNVLGEEGDSASSDTVFGQVNWIRDSWSWEVATTIRSQLVDAKKISDEIRLGLSDYNKSSSAPLQTKALVQKLVAVEKLIGTSVDTNSGSTLFGKIKVTGELAAKLEQRSDDVNKVLGEYANGGTVAAGRVSELKNQVLAINKVPGVLSALSRTDPNNQVSIKNTLLGLRGILNSNKKLLVGASGKTFVNVWLEIGSIVFKTMATNPSTLISQDVEIKYYLPPEIRSENIMNVDPGLSAKYDSEKDQMYVEGTFMLAAGETRAWSVQTTDIWEISPEEIASLRSEADELYKPLEKTAYYAQGVSLRSDINASLDRISAIQGSSVTPEDKIRSYREARILKNSVDEKIAGLRDLVTQASAAGSLFGFVGGSQTVAVWGLIIIIAAGFIFMTTYMRVVTTKAGEATAVEPKHGNEAFNIHTPEHKSSPVNRGGMTPLKLAVLLIVTSAVSSGSTGLVLTNVLNNKDHKDEVAVLGEEVSDKLFVEEENIQETMLESENFGTGGPYNIIVGDTPTGFLTVSNSPGGIGVVKVKSGDKLVLISEINGWYEVELENGYRGWVTKEYSSRDWGG